MGRAAPSTGRRAGAGCARARRAGSDVGGAILSPPRAAQAVSRDPDAEANTVTLLATDSVLTGVRPGCVTVTKPRPAARHPRGDPLHRHPPAAEVGGEPSPTPQPTPPVPAPFTHTDARLAASRSGGVSIVLEPVAAGFIGTVRIDPATGSGRSLGTATFRARGGRIDRRPRPAHERRPPRRSRQPGSCSVRLRATARSGATSLTPHTARATIRPPQRTRTRTRGE